MATKITKLAALIAGMTVLLAANVYAADLCLQTGSTDVTLVGKNLAIPPKGTCKPWSGYVVGQADNLLSGVICTTSDGTEVQANQTTNEAGEELESVINLPAKTGTTNDCIAGSGCTADTVAVVKCSKSNSIAPAGSFAPRTQPTLTR